MGQDLVLSEQRQQTLRGLEDVRHRLQAAANFAQIGDAAIDGLLAAVHPSSAHVCPLYWGSDPACDSLGFSDRFPMEFMRRRAFEAWPMAEMELGPINSFYNQSARTLYLNEFFGQERLERTTTYNDYWRQCHIERHFIALMGTSLEPLGFICAARSAAEPPLSEDEFEALDALRNLAEEAVQRITPASEESPSPSFIVTALSAGLPQACGLFDERTRLLWVNAAAERRLNLKFWHTGGTRFMLPANSDFQIWCEAVRDTASLSTGHFHRAPLTVNRVARPDGPPLFLVVEGGARTDDWHCLTKREREIAQLAIQGYQAANVSALLGLSVGTVRNHLKSIYRKTGVSSQLELSVRMHVG